MTENVLRIKIKKNNYGSGSLDFWIYDPEKGGFDEKENAFSDENKLLKFVSDQRSLDEIASDMLKTLIATYSRVLKNGKIQIYFSGTTDDFDVLRNALEELHDKAADHLEVIHIRVKDPVELRRTVCEKLNEYNLMENQFMNDATVQEFHTITPVVLPFKQISFHAVPEDAQSILIESERVQTELGDVISSMKSIRQNSDRIISDAKSAVSVHQKKKDEFKKRYQDEFRAVYSACKKDVLIAYNNATIKFFNQKKAETQTEELSAEQMAAFADSFLNDFRAYMEDIMQQTLAQCFREVWDGTAKSAEKDLAKLYGIPRCKLRHKTEVPFDLISRYAIWPKEKELKKYTTDPKRAFTFFRTCGWTTYDAKTKTFTVNWQKYAELFNKESTVLFDFFCAKLFQSAIDKYAAAFDEDLNAGMESIKDAANEAEQNKISVVQDVLRRLPEYTDKTKELIEAIATEIDFARNGGELV